ncbi:MAG TPA: metal ABC transporter permease [Kofleriaceae bacterium]|nr:metal ABC transporter permease [Kofleriaceae bacterium]
MIDPHHHVGSDDDFSDVANAIAADSAGSGSGSGAEAHTGTNGPVDTLDEEPSWSEFWGGWAMYKEAVYSGAIAGLSLGFLSVYVVLRRMVFVSAAVTQAAGLGVAASFWVAIHFGISLNPAWGATFLSLLTAVLLAGDPKRLGLSREMVLGMVFAFTSGAAVLIGSRIPQETGDIQAILFGNAVVVSPEDLQRLVWTSAGIIALHVWWFRGFAFASFDPISARVQGLPVRMLDLILLLSVGVMVGEVARALGAMPAFAMSTLPGMAALLVVRGPLPVTFAVASILGAMSGVGGYLLAYKKQFSVGPAQTVVAVSLVVIAALVRLGVGVGVRLVRRRRRLAE